MRHTWRAARAATFSQGRTDAWAAALRLYQVGRGRPSDQRHANGIEELWSGGRYTCRQFPEPLGAADDDVTRILFAIEQRDRGDGNSRDHFCTASAETIRFILVESVLAGGDRSRGRRAR